MFLFSVNDVLGKWLAGTYAPPQILLFRNIASLILLTPVVSRIGFRALLAVERPWLQVLRAAIVDVRDRPVLSRRCATCRSPTR